MIIPSARRPTSVVAICASLLFVVLAFYLSAEHQCEAGLTPPEQPDTAAVALAAADEESTSGTSTTTSSTTKPAQATGSSRSKLEPYQKTVRPRPKPGNRPTFNPRPSRRPSSRPGPKTSRRPNPRTSSRPGHKTSRRPNSKTSSRPGHMTSRVPTYMPEPSNVPPRVPATIFNIPQREYTKLKGACVFKDQKGTQLMWYEDILKFRMEQLKEGEKFPHQICHPGPCDAKRSPKACTLDMEIRQKRS